jgi:hypothetical protein
MTMSGYVLIVTIIHASIGAVDTQREAGFSSYQDCATEAVARIETQQQFYPDARIKWHCECGDE